MAQRLRAARTERTAIPVSFDASAFDDAPALRAKSSIPTVGELGGHARSQLSHGATRSTRDHRTARHTLCFAPPTMQAPRCTDPHQLVTSAWVRAIASLTLLASSPAKALDSFEIQVYEAEVNEPGQFGLELHSNYVFRGTSEPAYEGQIVDQGAARFTLEPALGITEFFEVGMYLQGIGAPGEGFRFGGAKLRGKFVVPARLALPLFLGLNVEIGKVPERIEQNGWANEFRPIIGYRNGWVLVDANPIIGYAMSGPNAFHPDFEPAGKLAVNTQMGFELGVEYYASLGFFRDGFVPFAQQEHVVFGTLDLAKPANMNAKETADEGAWEVNVGVGRGLTASTGPEWLVKTIVGHAF